MKKHYSLLILLFSIQGYSNSFTERYISIPKISCITVVPVFGFNSVAYCQNSVAQPLPTISLNGISGTWFPSSIDTNIVGITTYIFTPNIDQDATTASIFIIVSPEANAGILSGIQNICVGLTSTFTSTVFGGTWSSANTTIATISPVTGVITGIAAGVTTMTYTVLGSAPCPDATTTRTVVVNGPASAGTLSGNQAICNDDNTTVFTSTVAGGTWSSSDPSVATINATTGLITPVSDFGTTIMTYIITDLSGCGSALASRTLTIMEPILYLTSGNDNESVCLNTSLNPITYVGMYLVNATVIGLPTGVTATFINDILTISGTPTVSGIFEYEIHSSGICNVLMMQNGIITVNNSVPIIFCDYSQVTTPNSIFYDWNPIIGVTNYIYYYTIDGGPVMTGSTMLSHYEVLGVLPGQTVTFSLNINQGACQGVTSIACTALANVDFETDSMQYYPNPVNDILNITNLKTTATIQILNAIGQQVYSKRITTKDTQIEMSTLTKGIYIFKVTSENQIQTFKVIKR